MRAAAPELLAALDAPSVWDAAIAAEPGPPDYVGDGAIDGALQAMGAFADLKSSYTRGHSSGVAELAAGGGRAAGAGAGRRRSRCGARPTCTTSGAPASPPASGRRRGRSTDAEWEKVRLHAHYTEQILARPPLLARLGALGALDHERTDGSGYPHRRAADVAARGRARAGGRRHVPGDARDAPAPAGDPGRAR